jgi:hypothetical protein
MFAKPAPIRPPLAGRPVRVSVEPAPKHPQYLQVRMLKTVGTAWQSCFAGDIEMLPYQMARDWIADGFCREEP